MAAGRMRGPGLAAVRPPKADGRWDARVRVAAHATVPADLAAELARDARARAGVSTGSTGLASTRCSCV